MMTTRTVTIGGKSFAVAPTSLGFVRNKLIPWRRRAGEAKDEVGEIDWVVEGIRLYVPEAETDFLLEHVVDVKALFAELSGTGPPGEAKGP